MWSNQLHCKSWITPISVHSHSFGSLFSSRTSFLFSTHTRGGLSRALISVFIHPKRICSTKLCVRARICDAEPTFGRTFAQWVRESRTLANEQNHRTKCKQWICLSLLPSHMFARAVENVLCVNYKYILENTITVFGFSPPHQQYYSKLSNVPRHTSSYR